MQVDDTRASEAIEFRLVVRIGVPTGWRAEVIGPDAATHAFVSPFELARFLAWPRAAPVGRIDRLR